jgi:alpha-glucosidase
VGAPTTWVLSNHDVVRHSSRLGLADPTSWPKGIGADDEQPSSELGLSRARALSLLMLALPGSAYLFEGEELGLPEHTTLPARLRQDPAFARTAGAEIGRDGCRVPLPWRSNAPAFGFSETGRSWLPQPKSFRLLAVDQQDGADGSTLEFYRAAIALRKQHSLGTGALGWKIAGEHLLHVANRDIRVIVNFGREPLPVPHGLSVILMSENDAVVDGELQPNRGIWLA